MLRISTNDANPIIITPELTSPLVYLDYCVIVELAGNPARGQEFREALLDKGGTLYLSWAHLVELFGLGVGPTYERIRAYLASFGRSFVLIDSDSEAVIAREARWKTGWQNPVIDEDFLRVLGANWDGRGNLDATTLLDVMSRDRSLLPKYQALHRDHKQKMKRMFDDARAQYRADAQARRRLDGRTYSHSPGTPPTSYISEQMVRGCITTNDVFTESDGLDFEHCIVSVAYCDFVVLDQKWTRRCRAIHLPAEAARVFSIVELDAFVAALRAWVPPAG
jgi:hypothetical protein